MINLDTNVISELLRPAWSNVGCPRKTVCPFI